ncbi:hypothetical protein HYV86_04045 [Candidatus Woesearchaeota archaeon]|nr:hypothetical protein [Candidatus Woesearchaeota archaeon]
MTLGHNCGLVVTHSLHDAYNMLRELQHRGRDAAGIAAVGNGRIDVLKWVGPVDAFGLDDLHRNFRFDQGYHTFMAHVRYATRGKKDQLLNDAHPHTLGGRVLDRGNHVLILDCDAAMVHNGQVDEQYLTGVDKSALRTTCDTEALLHFYRDHGIRGILREIPGAYTLAVADRRHGAVQVCRDRTGIKPGVLGWKDQRFGVASEGIAFRKNGGTPREELVPGSAYYLFADGRYETEEVVSFSRLSRCFFEWFYIGHPETVFREIHVGSLRSRLGRILAEEVDIPNADFVTYLPRCPEIAADSFARAKGLPFVDVFYKQQSERVFQGPNDAQRQELLRRNLHLVAGAEQILAGKHVILVDDSVIRGTNSRYAIDQLKAAGARDVTLLSYTPPIGIIGRDQVQRGCDFGVDMPATDTFVVRTLDGRNRTLDEISAQIGVKVHYLSQEGFERAFRSFGVSLDELCTFCIGGEHPFAGIVQIGEKR